MSWKVHLNMNRGSWLVRYVVNGGIIKYIYSAVQFIYISTLTEGKHT